MFSHSSEEWKKLKQSDREKLGIVFENDGEFWSVHLFLHNIIIIVMIGPKSDQHQFSPNNISN